MELHNFACDVLFPEADSEGVHGVQLTQNFIFMDKLINLGYRIYPKYSHLLYFYSTSPFYTYEYVKIDGWLDE